MYFEANIARPQFADPEKTKRFIRGASVIVERHNALNSALNAYQAKYNRPPERFAHYVAQVFSMYSASKFDALPAEKLADLAAMLDDGTTEILPRLEWAGTESVVDCRFLSNADWELVRHVGIGGSDAASIMGMSPYKTALDTYYDKVGMIADGDRKERQAIFDRGHYIEDRVIDEFCRRNHAVRIPEHRMLRRSDLPFITANIDAICRMPNGELVVFEAKTTVAENFAAWLPGCVPPQYVPQMRHYPSVLNNPASNRPIVGTYIGCLFVKDASVAGVYAGSSYNTEDFKCEYMPADENMERDHIDVIADWWNNHVLAQTPPDLSGTDAARNIQTLKSLEADGDPEEIQEFPAWEWKDAVSERMAADANVSAARKALEDAEAARTNIDQRFIEALEGHTEGRMPVNDQEYIEVKYSPRSRVVVDTEGLKLAISGLQAYGLPNEAIDALNGTIQRKEGARVFSLKLKRIKKAPARKTK